MCIRFDLVSVVPMRQPHSYITDSAFFSSTTDSDIFEPRFGQLDFESGNEKSSANIEVVVQTM